MNCFDPSPVAGVTFSPFSDTTEGATISLNCEPGLEPQMEDVSVCCSNGLWAPDPVHRICSPPPSSEGIARALSLETYCDYCYDVSLDCSQPVLTPNVSVVSTTGTTEGDTVTLQCEDGLFPELTLVISCNRSGVWSPDPAQLVCISLSGEYN